MFRVNILVDGTPETLFAAIIAISLSETGDKKLHAYGIIDGQDLLSSTGFTGPGLCGSGVFINAYESMLEIRMSILDALMESLQNMAGGRAVAVEPEVIQGKPVDRLPDLLNSESILIVSGHESNAGLIKHVSEELNLQTATVTVNGEGRRVVLLFRDKATLDDLIPRLKQQFPGAQIPDPSGSASVISNAIVIDNVEPDCLAASNQDAKWPWRANFTAA